MALPRELFYFYFSSPSLSLPPSCTGREGRIQYPEAVGMATSGKLRSLLYPDPDHNHNHHNNHSRARPLSHSQRRSYHSPDPNTPSIREGKALRALRPFVD